MRRERGKEKEGRREKEGRKERETQERKEKNDGRKGVWGGEGPGKEASGGWRFNPEKWLCICWFLGRDSLPQNLQKYWKSRSNIIIGLQI